MAGPDWNIWHSRVTMHCYSLAMLPVQKLFVGRQFFSLNVTWYQSTLAYDSALLRKNRALQQTHWSVFSTRRFSRSIVRKSSAFKCLENAWKQLFSMAKKTIILISQYSIILDRLDNIFLPRFMTRTENCLSFFLPDENMQVTRHSYTMKYLLGLALGKWLVSHRCKSITWLN